MKRKSAGLLVFLVGAFVFLGPPPNLYAGDVENVSYIERGFSRILTGAFALPWYLINKTLNEPPIFGTIDGIFTGTFYTVSQLSGGVFDIVRGVLPYAKYLIFFV